MKGSVFFAKVKLFIKHNSLIKKTAKYLLARPVFLFFYRLIYLHKMKKSIRAISFPRTLSIEVTNACNAKCIMCPRDKMTRALGIIDDKLFQSIVDQAKELGVNSIQLMHFGEPLMDKNLPAKIAYIKKQGIKSGIFTNGSLLNPMMAEEIIRSGLDYIWFSFDAFQKDTYEKIRRGLEFNTVIENIKVFLKTRERLRVLSPKVSSTFVASKENYSEVDKFRDYWDKIVDEVEISTVDNYAGSIGIEVPPNKKFFLSRQTKMFPCDQLWRHFVILWDGRVALCCKDYDGEVVFGDSNKESLIDIWNGKKAKDYRKMHMEGRTKELSLCSNCRMHKISHLFCWWYS